MTNYEMMFIVKTTIEEEAVKNVVEATKSIITSMKGEITDSKELGNKKLAYPINKEITGYYFVLNFTGSEELVNELDRKSRIDENIIRHMIIRLDEE